MHAISFSRPQKHTHSIVTLTIFVEDHGRGQLEEAVVHLEFRMGVTIPHSNILLCGPLHLSGYYTHAPSASTSNDSEFPTEIPLPPMILTINSGYFPVQHKSTVLNAEAM
jgi:hypothetical protein